MIFSPRYHRDIDLAEHCEILSITTDDGIELEGVVCEPKEHTNTLLYFGGRSQDTVGLVKKLSESLQETRVITFNYRSYGRSEGSASEKSVLADSLLIADLIQKNYGDFYILGYSLGSSVGAYVASKKENLGVFLVGSFDSIASLAKRKYKLDFSNMFRYKFRTIDYVRNIASQTYLFVSKSDETTYIQNARKLKESIKNLIHYEEFDNLTHKEILWDDGIMKKISEIIE